MRLLLKKQHPRFKSSVQFRMPSCIDGGLSDIFAIVLFFAELGNALEFFLFIAISPVVTISLHSVYTRVVLKKHFERKQKTQPSTQLGGT